MAEINHPMQPIVIAPDGVIRFAENPIISWLCREVTDLKKIAAWCAENNIDDRHQAQLAQLIGYSVSGWGGLSYVSEEDCAIADAKAAEFIYNNEETKVSNQGNNFTEMTIGEVASFPTLRIKLQKGDAIVEVAVEGFDKVLKTTGDLTVFTNAILCDGTNA